MKALLQGGTEINIKAEFFILFYFIIILKLSYASRKVYRIIAWDNLHNAN